MTLSRSGHGGRKRGRSFPARRGRGGLSVEVLEDRSVPATAFGTTLVGGVENLIRFDTATPGTLTSGPTPITNLQGGGGETIVGIDFRPATNRLYAITDTGGMGRLYTIDAATTVATPRATLVADPSDTTSPFAGLSGTSFGVDFNPTVDRLRVVSDAGQNLRVNVDTGQVITDSPLNPGTPSVVGSAYINNVNGATATTLYGIDSGTDALVIQNPPNNGTLTQVGAGLGVGNVTAAAGFDVRTVGATNQALAVLTVGGVSSLYTVNLTLGTATLVGTVGGNPVAGLAVAPEGFANTTLVGTTATFNGSPGVDAITFDQSGGLLRHTRFTAGDPGFRSDFDFDPTVPGDQTLSATNPAVTIIVNAGGADDAVTIGSPSAPADGLAATFQVNGQGGGDTLTVDDTASATARTVSVNGTTSTIDLGPSGPITSGTVERVTVNAGSGGDTINVTGTPAAATTINAGGGNDTVVFGSGATLGGGFLDGGPGSNTLDYSAYTTGVTVDLSAAQLQTLFTAVLSGAQEPGPLSSSPASGLLVGTLNAAQTAFTFAVTYQGLTGSPISGVHFHNQAAGVNGPIVRGLFPSEQNGLVTPSGTFAGVWSASDPTLDPPDPAAPGAPVRPLTAPSPVTPGSTLLQELLAGRIYFDIHTLPNFPSGEVRAQLIPQGTVGPATGTAGVRGFDNVTGGSGADALTGNANVNALRGGAGADTIVGGQGGDQVFGDAGDDLLVWNNGDGSDFLEGGANTDTVQVNGSPTGGDQFLVQVNPADPARLRFDRTNLGLFNLNIGTTEALDFNTLGGDDTATVEFAGGNPIPSSGIDFDGGAGNDRLVLQRSAGTYTATAETYTAGGPGAGTIALDGASVAFTNLSPVDDTIPTATFTFIAPAGSGALDVLDGPVVGGFQTTTIGSPTGAFELINFANKPIVTVNSAPGAQVIRLDNPTAATGLTVLTVRAGPAADAVTVLAVPPGVAITMDAGDGGDTVTVSRAGLPAGTGILIDGGPGGDVLVYDAGGAALASAAGPLPGQTTLSSAGTGAGTVVYQNFEQVNVQNSPGADTAVPTAALTLAATVTRTSDPTAYTFQVLYTDDTLVRRSSLSAGDVEVVAPNGAVIPATLSSVTPAADAAQLVATYAVVPPGGTWDTHDRGTYTVRVLANRVSDVTGKFVAAGALGTFAVDLPPVSQSEVTRFAVGAGPGGSATVTVYNADGSVAYTVEPFPGFAGGVRVAVADVNGDGVDDLVAGTGPGIATRVRVLDGKTKAEVFAVDPFEVGFTGGVFVAAGDVNADGSADLVITPDEGGGPRCRVFSGAGFGQIADFLGIEDPNFRGGARPAVGDLDGDGFADLVVAAGFGGGPRVAAFSGKSLGSGPVKLFGDFLAFEPELRNGTFVAAGDVDGDGKAELIAGGGPGGGPRVSVFDGADLLTNVQRRIADFFAGDVTNRGGIRVAVKDLDGDAKGDLVAGAGTGAGSRVTAYVGATLAGGTPPELFAIDGFPGFAGGVFVG